MFFSHSYEKSYKSLLDTMMRSDLALKGSFDGVELLIFPSNRLPEKSQRKIFISLICTACVHVLATNLPYLVRRRDCFLEPCSVKCNR